MTLTRPALSSFRVTAPADTATDTISSGRARNLPGPARHRPGRVESVGQTSSQRVSSEEVDPPLKKSTHTNTEGRRRRRRNRNHSWDAPPSTFVSTFVRPTTLPGVPRRGRRSKDLLDEEDTGEGVGQNLIRLCLRSVVK